MAEMAETAEEKRYRAKWLLGRAAGRVESVGVTMGSGPESVAQAMQRATEDAKMAAAVWADADAMDKQAAHASVNEALRTEALEAVVEVACEVLGLPSGSPLVEVEKALKSLKKRSPAIGPVIGRQVRASFVGEYLGMENGDHVVSAPNVQHGYTVLVVDRVEPVEGA